MSEILCMQKFAPVQDKNMPKLAWETVEAPNHSRQPTTTTTPVNFYEVPQQHPRTTVFC
jgi:hypothetical protein